MEKFEESVALEKCTDIGKARLVRSRALLAETSHARSFMSSGTSTAAGQDVTTSPTKELDALILGNSLVGYGDNISLENMTVIENLIKFSRLEADREAGHSSNPAAWHREFLSCMRDMGCSVPIEASVEYSKTSVAGTMKNVMTDIVKAGVNAAKAAIPGAAVLGAIADSTVAALEKETETINLFNYEVTKTKGVKLAILPCDQTKNGLIVVSFSSVNHDGNKLDGKALFLDLNISTLDVYQGSNFLTFNPSAYAEVKEDVEHILGFQRRAVLAKRFSRRK